VRHACDRRRCLLSYTAEIIFGDRRISRIVLIVATDAIFGADGYILLIVAVILIFHFHMDRDLLHVSAGLSAGTSCDRASARLKRTGSVVTLDIVSCAVDGHNVVISHRNCIAKRICTDIGIGDRQHYEIAW
jgi:hypothetical protein